MWLHYKIFNEEVVEISKCCRDCMVPHGPHSWRWHTSPWSIGSKSISCRFPQTPCIFKYLKEWVEERLDVGFNTRKIYEDQKKVWFNARALGTEAWREDHLNMKSIQYYENKMRRGTWKWHNNDMTSVHMWVVDNPHNVFFWQKEDQRWNVPFTIFIQTPMQVVWMSEFIHNGAFFMDPTFGNNVQRYLLFIIIMFDHHRQDLLMAWVHKPINKSQFDSMVVTIEGTNCEWEPHSEAIMFHCGWHPSTTSCNIV